MELHDLPGNLHHQVLLSISSHVRAEPPACDTYSGRQLPYTWTGDSQARKPRAQKASGLPNNHVGQPLYTKARRARLGKILSTGSQSGHEGSRSPTNVKLYKGALLDGHSTNRGTHHFAG